MNGLIEIILLALIAGFLIWRLRSILGRRTEDEGSQRGPYSHQKSQSARSRTSANGNVIPIPSSAKASDVRHEQEEPIDFSKFAPAGSAVHNGLIDLSRADGSFHPAEFIAGAKSAYEIIVMAFANGDRQTLKSLLADPVYKRFEHAIEQREKQNLTVESEFIGVERADFLDVSLKDRVAKITIKFISDLVSITRNEDGNVVEGDPTKIKRVTDVWTFSRDVGSSDPNWKLVGTAAATA